LKLIAFAKDIDTRLAGSGIGLGIALLYLNGGWSAFRSANPMSFMEYYLVNDIGLLVIPIIAITIFGRNLSEYGLQTCDRKHLYVALAIGLLFFPIVLITAKSADFQSYYINAMRQSGAITDYPLELSVFGLIRHQVILVTYMFAWEWFFRGYLLNSVQRVSNSFVGVLVQAVLFTVMHLGKPTVEVISSFFGAVILGMWALRSRSMLPCFVVHALLTVLNDVAVIMQAR
jgi:membrane protease YdiL (CAAX protease family)